MRALLVLILTLALLPGLGQAEGRITSDCIALAQAEPQVVPVRFAVSDDVVRIRCLQHASFARETAGLLAITDFTGALGPAGIVPDSVTKNNAHDMHFTDTHYRLFCAAGVWGVNLPTLIWIWTKWWGAL